MHTRAERQMLPSGQPARGAAARFASLEYYYFAGGAVSEFF